MNVVIYSRVSSHSARQSTERQVIGLERFAAGRGYEVATVFEEKISGRKATIERPVLSRCLEYCTDLQNRVDMLLLTEISRLGRSTLEILKALDTLHTHKVCVYVQNLNLKTLRPDKTVNPLSSLITTLLGELAAMERQGIIDRLNSGRDLYIEKGDRLGRKPGSRKTAEQKKEEYREAIKGVQKVFGTLDLFVSLLETEIKYPILQGDILTFWTASRKFINNGTTKRNHAIPTGRSGKVGSEAGG